ncbi:MAG TPA: flagellar basal body-associated FliL family protein [Anaerohalosphaeraceae bacterium]|nr:flagellar basal body-associated FliL family protein [Anaerohalosphaeraceae bacterium]HOT72451.1 flagellar basal body-associated FliL family protein [Anaerohalosphaeraceae bacterium]HPB92600.1 flagellar basal body-associated FliL family protein [Anaerohalosphaeraceae bacterium]HQG05958.1 flagellar basal body-associated FliL family protein [Anaerohalosphaeraceae bacterium]HQI07240.1 flagellar basal body-associated FliL family protein [Anaerohalosphaeraceae bacterium]
MAEEKAKERKSKSSSASEETGKGSWGFWAMLAAVVAGALSGGFALCQLLGGTDDACPAAQVAPAKTAEQNFDAFLSQNGKNQPAWIYDGLEPVVCNLDEPGVTRYVRVTISLEMRPEMDRTKGEPYLEERKLILRDWLTTYFAGLSLEDVRGSRNLEKIKRQIQEQFNEMLFPNSRPYIQRVLFREFAVQ